MGTHDDATGTRPDGPEDDDDRRRRLVALLAAAEDPGREAPAAVAHGGERVGVDPGGLLTRLGRLCALSVSEVGVSGAGVTVMGSIEAGLVGDRDQLWATCDLARRLEDLQLTAGEGPCLDAFAAGAPVLAADLAAETGRWVGFGPEAVAAGAAAAFSLPLQIGAARLGTLDLHRDHPGGLSRAQLADALVLASLATETLLELARDPEPIEDGQPGTADPFSDSGWLPGVHAEVHQASGMVAAREHLPVAEALLRIRAYAFAHGEPINEVARRIIDRNLVMSDPVDDPRAGPAGPDTERDR